MKLPGVTPLSGAIMALLFITGAVVSYCGLSALATPHHFSARLLAAHDGQEAAGRATPSSILFPEGAVCRQATVAGSRSLHGVINTFAEGHGLQVVKLQVTPGPPDSGAGLLASIEVQLTAQGPQGDLLQLVADLEQASPMVFIDRLELRPKGGTQELSIQGRAFCSISVHR